MHAFLTSLKASVKTDIRQMPIHEGQKLGTCGYFNFYAMEMLFLLNFYEVGLTGGRLFYRLSPEMA